MAVFAYKAVSVDHADRTLRGTVAADSPRQARETLRSRGLRIEALTTVPPRSAALFPLRSRRMDNHVLLFTSELATLLAAGIPLLQSLDAIIRQHKGRFQQSLLLLRDRIAAGSSLAEAMRQQQVVFDELCVSLVEVGERAGTLDRILDQLAGFKQRAHQVKGRIATALIYPAIVVTAGVGVTVFLMTFVVPRLLEAMIDAGRPLPLATVIVKSASDFLVHDWWACLLLPALIAALAAFVRCNDSARLAAHRLLLRLPVLGDLVRKHTIVRIALTIATLTRSGVEFLQALRIVARSMPNLVFRQALRHCERAVAAGRDIAPSLEATGAFPPIVVQIFAVGQESGRLDEMLDRLASEYDMQVNLAANRFVAILEPLLILALAGFILCIVLAVILPYLEIGNVL